MAGKHVDVKFDYEKDTKNKVRFTEQGDDKKAFVVDKLYMNKKHFDQLGKPKAITVRIEAS